jgi:DNA repair exonuclease SbcCD ATPase subunit|tara:strand:+ start:12508 stop:12930 length:423 start_codon:yes stop_codon:yes gene_type:complete
MPDLTTISVALSSLKTSMDIAKALKNSTVSLSEAEQKLKVAELISSLADLKTELADVKINLIDKDDEIRKLNEKINEKESLSFDGQLYWKEGDKTPFCPVCKEKDEKYHHLTYHEGYQGTYDYDGQESYYSCKICGKVFD